MTTDSGSPDETGDRGEPADDELPGFTPAPTPPEEIEALQRESEALRQADAELDRWFENDFGGMKALKYFLVEYDQGWDESRPSDIAKRFPELLVVVDLLALNPDIRLSIGEPRWSRLARETKVNFREISESLHLNLKETIGEESAVDQTQTLDTPRETDRSDLFDDVPDKSFDAGRLVVPGEHIDIEPSGLGSAGPMISRWIWVGGGFGVIGLVLVGVFVFGGSDDPDPPVLEDEPSVAAEETMATIDKPPTSIAEEEPATTVVAEEAGTLVADVAASAFPVGWNFTATKTAVIVPAPDFISATPIGAVLPWSVEVTESCTGDDCTYTSVVRPLIPEVVSGEVPEATWVVEGADWSLDAVWFSTQSSFGETVCLIEKHWTYQFTVTEAEVIEGRSVATAISGTWIQRDKLDLAASTGDLSFCGEPWELADEWSVVGIGTG